MQSCRYGLLRDSRLISTNITNSFNWTIPDAALASISLPKMQERNGLIGAMTFLYPKILKHHVIG